MFDVCGIGNPLVDLLVHLSEEDLALLELPKGRMTLIHLEQVALLQQKIQGLRLTQRCGDSTANTLSTLALLGRKVAFVGKTGKDELGEVYTKELEDYGITHFSFHGKTKTGMCFSFITPDAERTMATYLGACLELEAHEVPLQSLSKTKMLYLTGYQLEHPLKEAAHVALAHAKKENIDVAVDLADAHLIKRNKEFLHTIIQDYASFVFANEQEALALTGEQDYKAAEKMAFLGCTAIVKIGERGSIVQKGRMVYDVPAFPVLVKDTTGAGDNYAAGFIHGYLEGFSLPLCGLVGSLIAAECVQRDGARLPKEEQSFLRGMIYDLVKQYTKRNGGGHA